MDVDALVPESILSFARLSSHKSLRSPNAMRNASIAARSIYDDMYLTSEILYWVKAHINQLPGGSLFSALHNV
jgi:hypothetical protein